MTLSKSNIDLSLRIKYLISVKRKEINTIAAFLVSMLIVLLFILPTVCEPSYKVFLAAASGLLDVITKTGSYEQIQGYMSVTALRDGASNALSGMTDILKQVGIMLCVTLWLPTLLTAFTNNNRVDLELFIKKFIILGVSLALIANANTICSSIAGIGDELMAYLSKTDSTDIGQEAKDAMYAACDKVYNTTYEEALSEGDIEETEGEELDEDASVHSKLVNALFEKISSVWYNGVTRKIKPIVMALSYILALILPALGALIARIFIMVACYSRGIEIIILSVLSPIPFAIVTNDPFGSGVGVRFMKNVGALAIQGVVMMAIAAACSALLSLKLQDMSQAFLAGKDSFGLIIGKSAEAVGVIACEAAMLIKSLSISQKLLGLA